MDLIAGGVLGYAEESRKTRQRMSEQWTRRDLDSDDYVITL